MGGSICGGHESVSLSRKTSLIRKQSGKPSDFYEIREKIGEGSFGEVYLVKEKRSGMIRAMKSIDKSRLTSKEQKSVLNEIKILSELDHPNILKLYETIESPKHYHLITEYLEGGDLIEELRKSTKFSEETTAKFIKDILSGLAYMHSLNVIHGDIKPDNLLLDNVSDSSGLKIIDFGEAQVVRDGFTTGITGTVFFT